MRKLKYSPQLDGLRSFCILFTIFNHIEGVPTYINGSVGVDVFFALSGFLITGLLIESNWSDLKGYYIRRFFRIAPVYYLVFSLTVALVLFAYYSDVDVNKIDQLHDIFWKSLFFSRELSPAPTLFGQAWTIGIEEKFYIVWPVIFLLAQVFFKRIVILFFFGITAILFFDNISITRGYTGIIFGCVSALFYFHSGLFIKTYLSIFILCLAYFFVLIDFFPLCNLLVSFGASLLIPALYHEQSKISMFLALKPISYLGKLTYSIYMFHVIILWMVKLLLGKLSLLTWYNVFIIGYPLTIAVSYVVYKHYEFPLIEAGKKLQTKS